MALSYHGRWQNAAIPNDSINRVVLPLKSILTRLIIEDIHLRLLHSGPSHTFLQLWMKHCILKARTEVKKILKIFLICVRHQGGSCNMKTMTPWPKSLVPESLAFKHIVLDYFEPLYIKKERRKYGLGMHIHLHYYKSNTPWTYRRHDIRTILVSIEKICGMPRENERNNIG